MTLLPMVLIPVYLVPLSIVLHLASLTKLRREAGAELPTLGHKPPRGTRGQAYPLRAPLTKEDFLDDRT